MLIDGGVKMFGFSVPDRSHPPLRKSPKLEVFSLAIARIHEPWRIRKFAEFPKPRAVARLGIGKRLIPVERLPGVAMFQGIAPQVVGPS